MENKSGLPKMRTPTDDEKYQVLETYQEGIKHLQKLGLIQIVDGVGVRATDKGLKVLKGIQLLEDMERAE
jgi:hypothetical protein